MNFSFEISNSERHYFDKLEYKSKLIIALLIERGLPTPDFVINSMFEFAEVLSELERLLHIAPAGRR